MSSTKMVLAIMVMFVEIGGQVMVIFHGQMEHITQGNLLIIYDMEKVCLAKSILKFFCF